MKRKLEITKPTIYDRKYYSKFVQAPFVIAITLCFVVFSLYQSITDIVFGKNKVDVFTQDLPQIALYFYTIDPQFSNFLIELDDIVQAYVKGENIMQTKSEQIEETWNYISTNKEYIKSLWYDKYDTLLDFIADGWKYKDEVFELLGNKEPHNYLVLLQYSNEKRPNGWFFWSFAFITVQQGFIKDLKIVDAYYPDFIAYKTWLTAPDWSKPFLPERKIGFIAANKFWFTDIDGKNIKDLYELMFNKTFDMKKVKQTMSPDMYNTLLYKNIKGVIFIQTDLLEFLIPGFKKEIRERQFVNASVDLIRWEIRGNKKEKYIDEVNDYFRQNQQTIIKNLINKFPDVLANNLIHVYLSNASEKLNGLLQKRELTNIYNPQFIYARDTNNSFNKTDEFVQKQILIINQNNDVVIDSAIDKIKIDALPAWAYTMKIVYTLDVPSSYINFIKQQEEAYNITLTNRERGILGLEPNILPEWSPARRRQSRSTIYFPPNATIVDTQGDTLERRYFEAPFANGLYYLLRINENHTSKTLTIQFTIK